MTSPRSTIIIVTYRSMDTIERALTTLAPQVTAGRAHCIVVDNDSGDGTADFVEESFPWVELIRSGNNLGYGRGCNAGLARARTEYVMFMNPDATVPGEALEALEAFLDEHPRVGMVAPAIRENGEPAQGAGPLPTPWTVVATKLGVSRASWERRMILPSDEPWQADWLCGAILLARRAVVEEVGGFDPRFFLYFEETDLCKRLRDGGQELWTVPHAGATHEAGASARTSNETLRGGCIAEHFYESRYYYLTKHHGPIAAFLGEIGEILVLGATGLARVLRGAGMGRHAFRARLQAPILKLPPVREKADRETRVPARAGG